MLESIQASYAPAAVVDIARPSQASIRIYPYIKRAFDLTAVVVTAPITLPLIGALALAVRLDGGKAFYTQQRLGKNGRSFRIWKLRSMQTDADRKLAEYLECNPEAREEWEMAQKLRHDPRITWIGRYLRKFSLDELPQLFNVLLGDMSLIGPRPMCVDQRPLYPGTAYYTMRPGLTGLWQVGERNGCSFAERAGYDTRYAEQLSLTLDMRILSQTFVVVARGTGV